MSCLFHRKSGNAWIDSDRRESRRLIASIVLLALALIGGIGLLIYALLHH